MRYAFFDGQGRVVEAHNDDTVCVLPAGATQLTDEQWLIRFDLRLQGGVLINDPLETPARVQETVWEKIKAARDRRTEYGGVQVDGRWFDTDTKSALRYKILTDIAERQGLHDAAVLRTGWRPLDVDTHGQVDMTYGLLKRIIAAGIAQALEIDDAAETHKAALYACADPATYDYSAGWPDCFQA